ncbi:hypothetical protein HW555_000211, partial [Spodoptera exigua]
SPHIEPAWLLVFGRVKIGLTHKWREIVDHRLHQEQAYQRGVFSIFYSVGSKPLAIWDTFIRDGYISKLLDEDLKSTVLEIGGTNVSTTYMVCPKGNAVLGICMPFLIMIVKNLKKYFSFEVTILDETGTRRRFRVSNFQSQTQILPLCTVMPIGLSEGWNQIQFNLAEFTRRAYKKQFVEVQKLKINANIRLRRIYFAERLIPEDQLPAEYKLFFPVKYSMQVIKAASRVPVNEDKSSQMVEIEADQPDRVNAATIMPGLSEQLSHVAEDKSEYNLKLSTVSTKASTEDTRTIEIIINEEVDDQTTVTHNEGVESGDTGDVLTDVIEINEPEHCGANPLAIWDMEVQNGHIKRLTDNEVNSIVLEIVSTNVATTYITCPKNNQILGIKLPFLVMIVKNLKRYFSFEITILDDKNMRRRFRISNFQSTTKIKPFCTSMPIGLAGGWNQIQFNLADFTRRAYGTQFIETLRVQVHANARLRLKSATETPENVEVAKSAAALETEAPVEEAAPTEDVKEAAESAAEETEATEPAEEAVVTQDAEGTAEPETEEPEINKIKEDYILFCSLPATLMPCAIHKQTEAKRTVRCVGFALY